MTMQLDHGGWTVTTHAQEQMRERGIDLHDLDAALWHPTRTWSSPKPDDGPEIVYYAGNGITAVVHEIDRAVITVGIDGGAKDDWRETERRVSARDATVPRMEQPTPAYRTPRARRTRPRAAPVETRGPNELVWAHALAAADGDPRRLEWVEATDEVVIHNRPRR